MMFRNKNKDRLFDCIMEQVKHVNESNNQSLRVIQESYNVIIKMLGDEIKQLKQDNNDLLDRLMSYTDKALHTYKQVKNCDNVTREAVAKPVNPFEILDGIKADTKEEKEEKAQARSEIAAIMGHG
jgi:hypothetical protein